jgi:hypothetical protein
MKKIGLIILLVAVVGAGSFYGGFRVGEFNGGIERAAKNTGPLMNLLLTEAGMKKELLEMNREQLYSNLTFYEAAQSSRLVTPANKKWLKENILLARDYWMAAGGTILQTEDEAKKNRQQVEEIRKATGVQMGVTLNGIKVSPFYFEEEDRRVRSLFDHYAGQTSVLHGMVKKAKELPNRVAGGN